MVRQIFQAQTISLYNVSNIWERPDSAHAGSLWQAVTDIRFRPPASLFVDLK
jgi:hypothetical protein